MPQKLLIVDDEDSMCRFYARMFSGTPYSFTLAMSLAGAKALMSANAYDLLITDIQLPDGNGIELVKLANLSGGTRTIIVSGAYDHAELRTMADTHNVPVCFSKPFPTDDLLAAVAGLLAMAGDPDTEKGRPRPPLL